MSDSSEDEDLSRFKDVVDNSFTKLFDESRNKNGSEKPPEKKLKSERYLETATHYNDVKVPEELQKRIGAKVSAVIHKNIEFVDIPHNGLKKRKIKGGIKLFKNSEGFLSSEEPKDTYTEFHNFESKKIKWKRRTIDDCDSFNESDKVSAVVVSGDYVLSKQEIKCWKSRRKEKIFKYKANGKSKVLTAVE